MMKRKKLLIVTNGEICDRKDVSDVMRAAKSVEKAALSRRWETSILAVLPETRGRDYAAVASPIRAFEPDCVFNLFEGFSFSSRSEYEFVEFLEKLGIPFTGNSSYALRVCLDKQMTKKILSSSGINVPNGAFVKADSEIKEENIEFPVFLKPCFEDGSVGVDDDSLVRDPLSLKRVLARKLKEHPSGIMMEEYLPGREFNLGFMEDPSGLPEMLAVSATDFSKHEKISRFMSYASKWESSSSEYRELVPEVIDPNALEKGEKERLISICTKTAIALKCSGYFRIDIREKENRFFVIDVNPNPDINEDSGFMRQAYSKDLTYAEVIERIINCSLNPRSMKR